MASNQSIDDIVSRFREDSKQILFSINNCDTIVKILHHINTYLNVCLPNVMCSHIREAIYFGWSKTCTIKFQETCNLDITDYTKSFSMNYEIVSIDHGFAITKLVGNTIDDDWETKFFETLKYILLK